jgi:hypothetical protein
MLFKFGKTPPKKNKRTLKLSKYLLGGLPTPPGKLWREYRVPPAGWNMLGNDTVGDCTAAAIAHMVMLFTAHTGTMVSPTLEQTLAVYSAVTGYDPSQTQPDGTNPTDNGAAITDILAYWQSTGIAGHKILGWASIALDAESIRRAMYLFGAVDIGFNVPAYAMQQFQAGEAWDWDPNGDATIEGGHSVPLFGFGSAGFDCTTWGANQKMTNEFFSSFSDEAYCVITSDWIDSATGLAPNMLNLASLQSDLAAVRT